MNAVTTAKLPTVADNGKDQFEQLGFVFPQLPPSNSSFAEISLPAGWRIAPDPKFDSRDVIIDTNQHIQVEVFGLTAAAALARQPFMRFPLIKREFEAPNKTERLSTAPWQLLSGSL